MEKITQTLIGQAFLISLGLTFVVYILRGFGVLSMMPGYFLLLLIVLSFVLGVVTSVRR